MKLTPELAETIGTLVELFAGGRRARKLEALFEAYALKGELATARKKLDAYSDTVEGLDPANPVPPAPILTAAEARAVALALRLADVGTRKVGGLVKKIKRGN